MNQIYAIDSTRISHREYWWGTKSPLVIIGWITKWLRIRIPGSTDDPNFESTTPCVVEALPEDVMARFQPLGAELAALGFYDVAYHCFRDPGTQTTICWATFLHDSGTHFARIHQRIWGQSQKVSRALFPMFFTEFTDGTFFVSSSGKTTQRGGDHRAAGRAWGRVLRQPVVPPAVDRWQSWWRLRQCGASTAAPGGRPRACSILARRSSRNRCDPKLAHRDVRPARGRDGGLF